ncbi:MAG: hypothetical protein IH606_23650 [Burkholderiales bacterium]|nr:hypothetical protein [Burkholderiales bacterium]
MSYRGNDYDVSSRINTTDPRVVNDEVDRIYLDLYPSAPSRQIDRAFRDLAQLYRGEYPAYRACDTAYHDMQHALDATLAMARLIDGYERARIGTEPFGESLFRLGVITALFHDMGYVRERDDHTHDNGAEYSLTHVTRGSHFLRTYLPTIGMADMAEIAAELIHFTGDETPLGKINVPSPIYRLLGSMLGSADIIAQMSDRCYLEKCRDRLYPEFVAAGRASTRTPEGVEQVVFSSGEDLVIKSPEMFRGAARRLNIDLAGCYTYAQPHFGGQNLYLEEFNKNWKFAAGFSKDADTAMLKRKPPGTLST